MKCAPRFRSGAVLATALFLALASAAFASNGYFTNGYGTTCKGLAGACVALPQDTMIAATNPAGLAFLGKRYDIGLAVFNPNREYTVTGDPSGFPGTFGLAPGTVESDSKYFYIPHFGANWEISPNMTLGVSLYGHGGLNTDYPTATFFASSPTGVDLSQLFVGVPWAFKLGQRHSLGIMPVFVYQQFEAQGVGSFAPFSSAPLRLSDNGSDTSTGYGAKVGYLGRWTDAFSFGLSYQSEMTMGDFGDYAGLFAEQGGFNIPSSLTAGLALKAGEALTLTFDYQEIYYTDINSVSNPFLPNLVQSRLGDDEGAGFGWRDMEVFRIGLQLDGGGPSVWRLGFSKGDQPIPDTEVLFNILAPGVMEDHWTLGYTRRLRSGRAFNVAFMHAPKVSVEGANPLEVPGLQTIELAMDQYELEFSYSWGF